MASYVIAVSGGVDSVVLLDMMMKGELPGYEVSNPNDQLIVAHFDHGIRPESADDAAFVQKLAATYGLAYETRREELGIDASEEKARNYRYDFLRSVAQKYKATIITAHHADDVIETIAINLIRGTGWRGLAVMDSPDIQRPLLAKKKSEIIEYAKAHNLVWREDATNQDDKYLRNKVRREVAQIDEKSRRLLLMYREWQITLKREIDNETNNLIGDSPYSRYVLTHIPETTAMELTRAILIREAGQSPERPVLKNIVHAIKVFQAGKSFEVSSAVAIRFTNTHFVVEVRP